MYFSLLFSVSGQISFEQKQLMLLPKNFAEHTESILKVQEWINNLSLESNLRDYVDEENDGGEIDSPVSDIAVWDNNESANKLSVDTVEKPETPKQYTPFKMSTITFFRRKNL
ncbi:hypothetical protein TNIN_407521 [Trichonephila inaurata madagascariensis]|uniref:Uncharacterized protein n=1 Tax=Trichonephila inaurata madagascariensis TaxID=2747483 RepID=A0A8X7CDW7_9ARAC|nr:hypothetical protein TNIN_407521 [Trichonephila inaurata madagascariensis]